MHASRLITFVVLIAAGSAAAGCGAAASRDGATSRPTARTKAVTRTTTGRTTTTPGAEREPVARIGGTRITRGFLEHWIAVTTHGQAGAPKPPEYAACVQYLISAGAETSTTEELRRACRQRYEQSSETALSYLIHDRWLIGEAAEEGVKADQARVKAETTLQGRHGEEVRQTLASTGETISDFRLNLLLNQLSDRFYRKLERKVPAITGARISAYYRLHKNSFAVPERRDLYVVRIGDLPAANKAKRELERGTSFATIVENAPLMQPHEAHGGLIHGLEPDNWPEEPLSRDVFRAPLDTLNGPVQISLGYYIFKVVRRYPPRPRTLAEARPEVAQQLHLALRDRTISRFVTAFRRRWTSRTNCLPGYVVKYCKQYKPSKTASPEASTAL